MALAVAFSLLAALGFASGYSLIRVAMQRVSAPTATFFSVLTGAVLIMALALVVDLPEIKALKPVTLGWFALMGAMAYPVARLLNNTAITMVGVSRSSPLASLQPVFVFGLGMALLGERPNLQVSFGTFMVASGLVLVVLVGNTNSAREGLVNVRNLGYLLAMGGSAAFASRDVISRHVVSSLAPPLVTAGFALTIGGLMLFVITHRDVVNSIRRIPGKYILLCGLAGIFSGLAVASLFQALSRAPVTVVSPISATSPLITLVIAHIFLRRLETIHPVLVLGTLLSVSGVALVVLGAAST